MLLPFVPRNRPPVDYYAILQISANAEPDTVERVYRMLAQRFHPEKRGAGNSRRFHEVTEAYRVLSDPARRAQYDVAYHRQRRDRWRPLAAAAEAENEAGVEHLVRLAVLEVLCTKRRVAPQRPGLRIVDLEQLIGRPREHLEFAVWFLLQKQFIERSGDSLLVITAAGVECLERNYRTNVQSERVERTRMSPRSPYCRRDTHGYRSHTTCSYWRSRPEKPVGPQSA